MNPLKIDWKLIFGAVGILITIGGSIITFDRRINENKAEITGIKQMLVDREMIARDYRMGLDRRFDKIDGKLDRLVERKE